MADSILALQAENAMAAGSRTPTLGRGMNLAKAKEAAQDFEAFFLSQMLQPMFADLNTEEPFSGGEAETIWQSLQVDEYGKAFARKGGIGIADMVLREMIKMQEGN